MDEHARLPKSSSERSLAELLSAICEEEDFHG
jgi:1,2-phenylacetyl-CoA epoxidase catalytic subunit